MLIFLIRMNIKLIWNTHFLQILYGMDTSWSIFRIKLNFNPSVIVRFQR
jgi:hypothetical protein